jgi:hypothetical protein
VGGPRAAPTRTARGRLALRGGGGDRRRCFGAIRCALADVEAGRREMREQVESIRRLLKETHLQN